MKGLSLWTPNSCSLLAE